MAAVASAAHAEMGVQRREAAQATTAGRQADMETQRQCPLAAQRRTVRKDVEAAKERKPEEIGARQVGKRATWELMEAGS